MVKTVLITGGAGFVGPHLIQKLIKEGWEVYAVDNFFNGKRNHIKRFLGDPHFNFSEGDVTDVTFIKKVLVSSQPDVVYHLAAIHFIPYCIAHPRETVHANVTGTQAIIDALEGSSVTKFVFASTADVYFPSDKPHKESDSLGASNIYGLSKVFCEELLNLARIKYPEIKFNAVRFFNIYGPGETNPHLLPDIFACLKQGGVIRLGNMEPKRDYIYVEDLAEALYLLALYEGNERVFNLGTGIGYSVWEIVHTLEKVINSSLKVEIDPLKIRKVERQNLVSDISSIKKEIDWSPAISLEIGLKRTIQAEQIL
jgi:UDP-glucose 4-epimerase